MRSAQMNAVVASLLAGAALGRGLVPGSVTALSRDGASHKKVVDMLAAAVYTATQTPSTGVDTQGYDALTFVIGIGTITNIANSPTPSWAFKVQESDSASANFTDITDPKRILVSGIQSPGAAVNESTGVFLTIDAASEDAKVYHVGVISSKRYVRLVSTAANTPGNTPLHISAILERASLTPVSN